MKRVHELHEALLPHASTLALAGEVGTDSGNAESGDRPHRGQPGHRQPSRASHADCHDRSAVALTPGASPLRPPGEACLSSNWAYPPPWLPYLIPYRLLPHGDDPLVALGDSHPGL